MQQSTFHAAIIMDGNGRWAARRSLPRTEGHRRGASAVRHCVEAAPELGITSLTLFAFSSDNWKRPPEETSSLFLLLDEYLVRETSRCRAEGVRVEVIGRRDRIPARLRQRISDAECSTRGGTTLHLRIAIDYSSRAAMIAAARMCAEWYEFTEESFARALGLPPVDLVIRTGGEQRLSDFLLWESAYAEVLFLQKEWPDFTKEDLAGAVSFYQQRERRFGALPAA